MIFLEETGNHQQCKHGRCRDGGQSGCSRGNGVRLGKEGASAVVDETVASTERVITGTTEGCSGAIRRLSKRVELEFGRTVEFGSHHELDSAAGIADFIACICGNAPNCESGDGARACAGVRGRHDAKSEASSHAEASENKSKGAQHRNKNDGCQKMMSNDGHGHDILISKNEKDEKERKGKFENKAESTARTTSNNMSQPPEPHSPCNRGSVRKVSLTTFLRRSL